MPTNQEISEKITLIMEKTSASPQTIAEVLTDILGLTGDSEPVDPQPQPETSLVEKYDSEKTYKINEIAYCDVINGKRKLFQSLQNSNIKNFLIYQLQQNSSGNSFNNLIDTKYLKNFDNSDGKAYWNGNTLVPNNDQYIVEATKNYSQVNLAILDNLIPFENKTYNDLDLNGDTNKLEETTTLNFSQYAGGDIELTLVLKNKLAVKVYTGEAILIFVNKNGSTFITTPLFDIKNQNLLWNLGNPNTYWKEINPVNESHITESYNPNPDTDFYIRKGNTIVNLPVSTLTSRLYFPEAYYEKGKTIIVRTTDGNATNWKFGLVNIPVDMLGNNTGSRDFSISKDTDKLFIFICDGQQWVRTNGDF